MGLAAAVIGAGALGTVGSLATGLLQSSAASTASAQQAQQAKNALQQQKDMFGVAQGALNPYINAGSSTLPTLQALLNPGTAASTLQNLPGFQFQSQYGTMAAENALSAQGLGGSRGPLAKTVSDYNNGLAGTYYQNYVGGLQNFANMGTNAASSLAGNAINSGNAIAGTYGSLGAAQASGTLGSANALAGGIGGATSGIGNSAILNALLNGGGGSGNAYTTAGLYGSAI